MQLIFMHDGKLQAVNTCACLQHVPLLPQRHALTMTRQPEEHISTQCHVYRAEQQHWFVTDHLLT